MPTLSFAITNENIYSIGLDSIIDDNGGSSQELYAISLDSSSKTSVPNTDMKKYHRSHIAGVSGEYVYYWASMGEWFELARVKIDGSDEEILTDRVVEH